MSVLHAEPGGSFTPVWVLLAVTALGTAVDSVLRSPGDALRIVLGGAVVGLGRIGPYVYSKRRYGKLEVTEETLRIGKERFALADLDPARSKSRRPGSASPVPSAAGSVTAPATCGWGGAVGAAVGDRYVIVKVRDQPGHVAVATQDPPHLARLLHDLVRRRLMLESGSAEQP